MSTKLKKLEIIINPASGTKEPILSYINDAFKKTDIAWQVHITTKSDDIERFAVDASKHNPDAIIVYGGDGTVGCVAKTLYNKHIPLIALAGGTANVFAASIGMPLSNEESLLYISQNALKKKKIDMAISDNKSFLVTITTGVIADTVIATEREHKNAWGFLAYTANSLKVLQEAKPIDYHMEIDGKALTTKAISLMLVNAGNFFVGTVPLAKHIDSSDGQLDIIAIHSADILPLVEMGVSAVMPTTEIQNVSFWKAKNVTLEVPEKTNILFDDVHLQSPQTFNISVEKHAIDFLVPNINV